jgi:hypothetical protein
MERAGLLATLLLLPGVCGAGNSEVLIPGRDASPPRPQAAQVVIDFSVAPEEAATTAEQRVRREPRFRLHGQPARIVVGTPVADRYLRRRDGALAPLWVVDVGAASPWGIFRVFVDGQRGTVVRIIELSRNARGSVFPSSQAVADNAPALRRLPELTGSRFLVGSTVLVDDVSDFLALCAPSRLFCSPPRSRCARPRAAGRIRLRRERERRLPELRRVRSLDQVTGYFHLRRCPSTSGSRWAGRWVGIWRARSDPVLANIRCS